MYQPQWNYLRQFLDAARTLLTTSGNLLTAIRNLLTTISNALAGIVAGGVISADIVQLESAPVRWVMDVITDLGVGNQKDITVPQNDEWHVLGVRVRFVTVAGANRQLCIQLVDPGVGLSSEYLAGVEQAATLTRFYQAAPSLADLLAFRDIDWASFPLPPTVIIPGDTIVRVTDRNGISALDTIDVYLHYASRSTV